MMDNKLRGVLDKAPLAIFNYIRKKENKNKVIQESFLILPYSVGIEIESETPQENITMLRSKIFSVQGVMDCRVWDREISFRITNGFIGLCALYVVLETIKTYSMLNMGSGIHYHIDCSNWITEEKAKKIKRKYSDIILDNLDLWEYKIGTNRREVSVDFKFSWLNIRTTFKTFEFRIGEMTFEYSIILERIKSASSLVSDIKDIILEDKKVEDIKYPEIDFPTLRNYSEIFNTKTQSHDYIKYRKLLESLEKQEENKDVEDASTHEEINSITRRRKINIYGN